MLELAEFVPSGSSTNTLVQTAGSYLADQKNDPDLGIRL
jgi:hypothetical protein